MESNKISNVPLIIFAVTCYLFIFPASAHLKETSINIASAIANCREVAKQAAKELIGEAGEPNLSDKDDFLRAHNEVRYRMNEPPFTWDPRLEQYARIYGQQQASTCAMRHSNGPYGENLFEGGGTQWTPRDAVIDWIKEVGSYNVGHNTCTPGKMCGHFTQIIWKTSTRIGCARIICKSGDTFAICEYDPPGNYVNEMPLEGTEHTDTSLQSRTMS